MMYRFRSRMLDWKGLMVVSERLEASERLAQVAVRVYLKDWSLGRPVSQQTLF